MLANSNHGECDACPFPQCRGCSAGRAYRRRCRGYWWADRREELGKLAKIGAACVLGGLIAWHVLVEFLNSVLG